MNTAILKGQYEECRVSCDDNEDDLAKWSGMKGIYLFLVCLSSKYTNLSFS